MATYDVATAGDLQFYLNLASPGDTLRLAPGNYGDVTISGVNVPNVTIESADPTHPGTFNTLDVVNSSGLTFSGVAVDMAGAATTYSFNSAVMVSKSHDITFEGGLIKAELATNGVDPSATAVDNTGNIIGLPTGRGITIDHSSGVTVDHVEFTQLMRGIVLGNADTATITNNNIHDIRTTAISGVVSAHIVIEGNHLSNSFPWRWGDTPVGNHADYIHIWTDPTQQLTPSTDIQISNNVIDQGAGVGVLGIYLDDNTNKIGFTNVTIQNNIILTNVNQGIRLENVSASTVTGNTILDTLGANRHAPGIVAVGSAADLNIYGNVTDFAGNETGSLANIHDNTLVQDQVATRAGYYTPDLAVLARHLDDPATALHDVTQVLGGASIDSFMSTDGSSTVTSTTITLPPPMPTPPANLNMVAVPDHGAVSVDLSHFVLPMGSILL